MKFLGIDIESPVFLAPLAGYTDSTFRYLCREFGAGIVYSEMISAEGIVRQNTKTLRYAYFNENERPVALQLFGTVPETMAEAARTMARFRPEIIDINSGCPVKKVVKKGAGSALLRDLNKLQKIVEAVVQAVSIPVTVKIRSGWTKEEIVAVEASKMIQEAGAGAVIVHPRTKTMQFSGKAEWDLIRQVKEAVSIPVVGNGDITDFSTGKLMLDSTGCDCIMIGRAAIQRPWLFKQFKSYYDRGTIPTEPTAPERVDFLMRHLELKIQECGEYTGIVQMRKCMAWYTKGLKNAARIRGEIMQMKSYSQLAAFFAEYRAELERFEQEEPAILKEALI